MEALDLRDDRLELVGRRQEGRTKVEGVRVGLAKAGAGHNDQAGRVKPAVERAHTHKAMRDRSVRGGERRGRGARRQRATERDQSRALRVRRGTGRAHSLRA